MPAIAQRLPVRVEGAFSYSQLGERTFQPGVTKTEERRIACAATARIDRG